MPKGKKVTKIGGLLRDDRTGEILEEPGVFYTEAQSEQSRKYFEQQKRREIERQRINAFYEEQGRYCWLLYRKGVPLLPELESSKLLRLMRISAYLGYDGRLVFENGKPMSKIQLMELLYLSKSEFGKLWKKLVECGILWEDGENICVNQRLFCRGELASRLGKEVTDDVIRIYQSGIKDIYNSTDSRGHKLLGAVYRLIPYVHKRYHIVCHNPLEEELQNVQSMSWKEVCGLLGYNTERPNQLKERMLAITYGEGQKALSYDMERDRIFVSPDLFYAGTNAAEIKQLGRF